MPFIKIHFTNNFSPSLVVVARNLGANIVPTTKPISLLIKSEKLKKCLAKKVHPKKKTVNEINCSKNAFDFFDIFIIFSLR